MSEHASQKTSRDLHPSCFRLEQPGHILDTENMNTLGDKLVDEVKVVLESVLGLLGVGDITGVADNGFDNTTGLLSSVDTEFHLQRAESMNTSRLIMTTNVLCTKRSKMP